MLETSNCFIDETRNLKHETTGRDASPLLELFERIIRHAPIFPIPCHDTDRLSRVNPGS